MKSSSIHDCSQLIRLLMLSVQLDSVLEWKQGRHGNAFNAECPPKTTTRRMQTLCHCQAGYQYHANKCNAPYLEKNKRAATPFAMHVIRGAMLDLPVVATKQLPE